jgi:hypothetical protein
MPVSFEQAEIRSARCRERAVRLSLRSDASFTAGSLPPGRDPGPTRAVSQSDQWHRQPCSAPSQLQRFSHEHGSGADGSLIAWAAVRQPQLQPAPGQFGHWHRTAAWYCMGVPFRLEVDDTNPAFVQRSIVVPARTALYERADLHPARRTSARHRRAGAQSRRMAVGSIPNMRLCVRVRCDESAKPASCAASVQEAPAIAAAIATLMRSHRR